MYRRFNGTELWHLNAGCMSWPLLNFEEKEHPAVGKLCKECLELEQMVARRPLEESSTRETADGFRFPATANGRMERDFLE
jgi:hypothetical protein